MAQCFQVLANGFFQLRRFRELFLQRRGEFVSFFARTVRRLLPLPPRLAFAMAMLICFSGITLRRRLQNLWQQNNAQFNRGVPGHTKGHGSSLFLGTSGDSRSQTPPHKYPNLLSAKERASAYASSLFVPIIRHQAAIFLIFSSATEEVAAHAFPFAQFLKAAIDSAISFDNGTESLRASAINRSLGSLSCSNPR
jgi:hypothetical protein